MEWIGIGSGLNKWGNDEIIAGVKEGRESGYKAVIDSADSVVCVLSYLPRKGWKIMVKM